VDVVYYAARLGVDMLIFLAIPKNMEIIIFKHKKITCKLSLKSMIFESKKKR
jgi:hypothetical protein